MANPSGTHHQEAANHGSTSAFNGANPSNGNSGGQESLGSGLQHNPGISMDWTLEEQAILDEGLTKYAGESNVGRYAKIAMQLPSKTVRDVALRTRWMGVNKKENGKRRKEDIFARKSKDKKERFTDSSSKASHFMAHSNVPPYATPVMSMDYDEGIPYEAIDGATAELLKQNQQAFSQISSNLTSLELKENINLFRQTRENLHKIMNNLNDTPDIMKQMPPLPVKMNEELANALLRSPNRPMK